MVDKKPRDMNRVFFVLTIVVVIGIFLALLTLYGCMTPEEAVVVKEVVDVAYDGAPVNTVIKEMFRPLWEMGAVYIIGLLTVPTAKVGTRATKAVAGKIKNRRKKA